MPTDSASKTNLIDYLSHVDTPTLSNAIEQLRLRPQSEGFTPLQIRCLFPEFGRMCGYVVTAQVETMTKTNAMNVDMFLRLYEAVANAPKPVVIAFQEIGPDAEYAAHCGEVMATIFTRLGAVGLVSDCAVRDIPEVRALHFHYFARGAVASHAYFGIARIEIPIQVQGLEIRPGNILHGDENGLLLVPQEKLDELPAAVESVRSRERKLMEFVRGPRFQLDDIRGMLVE